MSGIPPGIPAPKGQKLMSEKGNQGSYQSIVNAFNEYIRVGTDSDWTEL
jgi:hypothetical protein